MDRIKPKILLTVQYLSLFVASLVVLTPLYIYFVASFKSNEEYAQSSAIALPQSFAFLDNFKIVFDKVDLWRVYGNTFFILAISVIVNVILGTACAYALGRFEFKAKGIILAMVMGARIIPGITTQVAVFKVIQGLGLYNTLWAPIVLYCGTDVIQIYMFLQFMDAIPYELDEAAMLDGASLIKIFYKIVIPLMKPAIATVIIIKAIGVYNEMYIPFLYLASQKNQVISTALMKFNGGMYGTQVNVLAACILLVMIFPCIFYLFFQKQIFNGLLVGAVKG